MNQVWKIRDGRLLWESGGRVICVDSEKIQEKVKAPQGGLRVSLGWTSVRQKGLHMPSCPM